MTDIVTLSGILLLTLAGCLILGYAGWLLRRGTLGTLIFHVAFWLITCAFGTLVTMTIMLIVEIFQARALLP